MHGRNVIVTGASRGIGAGIAQRMAAEGANLLLVARTAEKHQHLSGSLTEVSTLCAQYGTDVHSLVADLSREESRAEIIPAALDRFDGRIDVLVNNAAAAMFHPTAEMALKRRRIIFEVNVHAPADLMQAVLPGMRAQGEGWIVNITSGSAAPRSFESQPLNDIGTYGASKAALNRLTHAFAAETRFDGLRINAVAPRGAVITEGAAALVGQDILDTAESMEAMVEAVLAAAEFPAGRTGEILTSLDLLTELSRPVRTLDGAATYGGGYRPLPSTVSES
jgi:NAD(P)-dependent dehydrogenase (short-subunit alcohol dehydrogenase family)